MSTLSRWKSRAPLLQKLTRKDAFISKFKKRPFESHNESLRNPKAECYSREGQGVIIDHGLQFLLNLDLKEAGKINGGNVGL